MKLKYNTQPESTEPLIPADKRLPEYIEKETLLSRKFILAAQYWFFRGYGHSEITQMLKVYLGATPNKAKQSIDQAKRLTVTDAASASPTKRVQLEAMASMILRDCLENKQHGAAVNALKQLLLINNVGQQDTIAPIPVEDFIDKDLIARKRAENEDED